jgi:hypothetical protein
MENKLINELYRINQLMGVDNVIVENVATPIFSAVQKIFANLSDDVIEKFVVKTGIPATDDALDNIITKLKAGQPISKKSLNLLLSQIDGGKLSKIYTESKILMGPDFYDSIIRYEKILKSDPKKYSEAIDSINRVINEVPYLKNLPDNLKKSLKLELKTKMDDAVKGSKSNKSNTSLNAIKGLDVLGKGFSEGWKAPSLLKGVLNWNTLIPKYNAKGWVIFTRWLLTGTTRSIPKGFQQVWDTLVKQGIGKDFAKILAMKITSVGAEVFKRWLILNGVMFVLNQAISYFREMGGKEMSKRESTSFLEDIVTDIENNWGKFGPRWVWPVGTVTEPIFTMVRGIVKRETPGQIYDKMKSGNLPEQKELEKLNNEVENATLEKTSVIDKGELMLFKTKIKSKYPNFKYSNNLKIIDGVPYFVYEADTYPIYNYNSEYYIKHNGDVIYLDDLTQ